MTDVRIVLVIVAGPLVAFAGTRHRTHYAHVEVFDHDSAMLAGQPGGEFMQAVAA